MHDRRHRDKARSCLHPFFRLVPEAVDRAVSSLREGGLVGVPTETVYGLAADASNPQAVACLYEAKGRPRFNPLIAHVSGLNMARREATFPDLAERLAAAFWPGPLTLVLPVRESGKVCDLARAGLGTVALRWPAHPVMQDVIETFGGPLVAPSANPSGRLSPTSANHVHEELGDRIDLILDGGRCERGVESTVIAVLDGTAYLLRPGALPRKDIEAITGALGTPTGDPSKPASPGMLARHYAPKARLRLNAAAPQTGEAFLGFGETAEALDLNLSVSGDLTEAAANLFACLRQLDAATRPNRCGVDPGRWFWARRSTTGFGEQPCATESAGRSGQCHGIIGS